MSNANFFGSATSNFLQDDVHEETEADSSAEFDSRDMIIFAIDCSPRMMVSEENGNIPFTEALKCVQSVLLSKVFSNTTDLVGVVLFGTERKENPAEFDHIYILQELDYPTPGRIKQAENLITNEVSLTEEYGITTTQFPLGNVFWTCGDMFAAASKGVSSKRIFLITNNDNPHGGNGNLRRPAIQRAKDIWTREDDKDNTLDDGDLGDIYEQGNFKLEELMVKIRRKETRKRSQFSIPFHIGKDLTIGINGYCPLIEQKKATAKKVVTSGERIKEVQTMTTYKCVDSNLILSDLDVKYFFLFGGEKVVFTKEEIETMRKFDAPGLTLLGFKPRAALLPQYNYRHAMFIYPNEKDYEGSTRTFTALMDAALDQDKIVICNLQARINTVPRTVALLPQAEKIDDDGVQVAPPGFHLISLPFADDIRNIPIESTPQASDELLNSMKTIMNKLFIKSDYDPMDFQNPGLQQHYALLQAVALDEPFEYPEDKTIPKFETINNRTGEDILNFKNLIPNFKRNADEISDTGTRSNKRQAPILSVEEACRSEKLDKLTVPVLKEWLASKGITAKGNKSNLIAQVGQAMEQ
ncbi:SPOC like C-terminal domain-containing protein [Absidia repens]|uniref:ATP-dependent DNA helicase II subunit 1 n=1 Tax=Absidia repens TaxID=90262 RepID=A0A1X2IZE3_9FUNG|nr:SPOC like C-terminal domain-containing protein [Absidia repens]